MHETKLDYVKSGGDLRLAYKINEAAAIIGVCPGTVRRLIKNGRLKPCRVLRHVLIPVEQLRDIVKVD